MKNSDKARNIAISERRYYYDHSSGESANSYKECQKSAIEMANWKDSLLRKERSFQIERFNKYYDKKLNHDIQEQCLGAVLVIDKILGEDSTRELHCNFITLDNYENL